MNQEDEQNWGELISEYIDELDESSNQEKYIDELIAIQVGKRLLSDISGDDNKAIKKLCGKITKTPLTAKNKDKLLDFYNDALNQGWMNSISSEIEFISNKTDFYNIWISRSLEHSEGVLPATHCAKLTHSSSSGSSILDQSMNSKSGYITTSSQREKIIDGTYLNATYSKQVKLLMLERNGRYLYEEILDGNDSVFEAFSENEKELKYWIGGYQEILKAKPRTDILLKQLYFPVEEDYHLLTVLHSSSLAQQMHQGYFDKDARKRQDQSNKARRSEKFHPEIQCRLIGVNKLLITQSQHQNATVLNGKRGGIFRLLNGQPPTWSSQVRPPHYQKSWFYRGIPYSAIQNDIDYLRSFLLRNEQLALSTRNPQKRKWLIKWGQSLTDTVLFYAHQIQTLPSGWSAHEETKLQLSQQYFLDPFREDESFQAALKSTDWQSEVSIDFANWLNDVLKGKDKKFTPQKEHRKLWELLMKNALRESIPALDMADKQAEEERT